MTWKQLRHHVHVEPRGNQFPTRKECLRAEQLQGRTRQLGSRLTMSPKKAAASQKEPKSKLVVAEDEELTSATETEADEFIDSESKSAAPSESEVTASSEVIDNDNEDAESYEEENDDEEEEADDDDDDGGDDDDDVDLPYIVANFRFQPAIITTILYKRKRPY